MKPTKPVPIFKGGAVHLVDEEIAFMMAAEADKVFLPLNLKSLL